MDNMTEGEAPNWLHHYVYNSWRDKDKIKMTEDSHSNPTK